MNLILQTQLLPDGDQARKLSATMQAFNAAADWLAGEAFRLKTANKVELQRTRQHYGKVKRSLQRKATKQKRGAKRPLNAKRKLKALSGRERRFKANTNHTIAKRIVAKATDTGRGVAIENLV